MQIKQYSPSARFHKLILKRSRTNFKLKIQLRLIIIHTSSLWYDNWYQLLKHSRLTINRISERTTNIKFLFRQTISRGIRKRSIRVSVIKFQRVSGKKNGICSKISTFATRRQIFHVSRCIIGCLRHNICHNTIGIVSDIVRDVSLIQRSIARVSACNTIHLWISNAHYSLLSVSRSPRSDSPEIGVATRRSVKKSIRWRSKIRKNLNTTFQVILTNNLRLQYE